MGRRPVCMEFVHRHRSSVRRDRVLPHLWRLAGFQGRLGSRSSPPPQRPHLQLHQRDNFRTERSDVHRAVLAARLVPSHQRSQCFPERCHDLAHDYLAASCLGRVRCARPAHWLLPARDDFWQYDPGHRGWTLQYDVADDNRCSMDWVPDLGWSGTRLCSSAGKFFLWDMLYLCVLSPCCIF